MKIVLSLVLSMYTMVSGAQELFAVTEPASNMAARSIGLRMDHSLMDEVNTSKINYHFIPELMVGVSAKLMIHASLFYSNRNKNFGYEGKSLYAKYRFYSRDDMQQHFRMAAFARVSFNKSDIHQEEMNMYGHNTGYEAGVVATQLLKKIALSSSIAYIQAYDNGDNNKFVYGDRNSRAINATFSVGKLLLPKEYKTYRQTNLNLMLEMVSQYNTGSGKYFIEIVPSAQLIINSRARIDIGYKQELSSTLLRTAPNGLFIRLDYNVFNAF